MPGSMTGAISGCCGVMDCSGFIAGMWALSRALIYRWDMGRSFTRRSCILAWLLCALLTCLAIHSPHCDLCDGPLVMQLTSSQPHASHPAPIVPDGCNGMCWCCAFLAVPSIAPGVTPEQRMATALWPEPPSLVLDRSLSIDRPPRIAASA
jgi:hypothetical protein